MRTNSIFILLAFLPLLILPVACDSKTDEETQPEEFVVSFAEDEVTILVPAELEPMTSWEGAILEWEAQTSGVVKVVQYSKIDELLNQFEDEPPAENTILFFPRTRFADLGLRGLFQELPENLKGPDDFNWQDLYDSLQGSVTEWNDDPVVIPIREPMLLLYYRADLLEAAQKEPPQTWDDYLELLASLEDWAPGMTAVEPWGEDFRAVTFLAHALPYVKTPGNYSAFFDYKSGTPMIGSPGYVRGLEECQKVLTLIDPKSAQMDARQTLDELREGRAALAIGDAFLHPQNLSGTPVTNVKGLSFSVCQIPGAASIFDPGRSAWQDLNGGVNHVTLTGWEGMFVGVLEAGNSEDNQAAWNLMRWLMIQHPKDCFVPGYQTSTRLSTSTQIWSPQFNQLDERAHVEATRASLREAEVVPTMIIAERDRFLDSLTETVSQVLFEKSKEPGEALNQLSQQWEQMMEEQGKERLRLSYAAGLGVRALKADLAPKNP